MWFSNRLPTLLIHLLFHLRMIDRSRTSCALGCPAVAFCPAARPVAWGMKIVASRVGHFSRVRLCFSLEATGCVTSAGPHPRHESVFLTALDLWDTAHSSHVGASVWERRRREINVFVFAKLILRRNAEKICLVNHYSQVEHNGWVPVCKHLIHFSPEKLLTCNFKSTITSNRGC